MSGSERPLCRSGTLSVVDASESTLAYGEGDPRERLAESDGVRGLRVVRRDNGFVLQECTPTYYAKQLLLHAVMRVTALPILGNAIEVGHARQERHTACE